MPDDMIFLELETTGASGAIRVNDVPVVGFGPGGSRAYAPMPTFVTRGANRLTAHWIATGHVRVSVRVALFGEDEEFFTGAGRTLADVVWTRADGGDGTAPFDSPVGPPAWSWSGCRRWPSAADALAAAGPFVDAMVSAFLAGDGRWYVQAAAPKLHDMATAFPHRARASFETAAATDFAEGVGTGTRDRPTADGSALCGDGRLLHLLRHGGGELLHGRDRDGPYDLPMLIGQRDDHWAVFR